jgi:hypothetical protein
VHVTVLYPPFEHKTYLPLMVKNSQSGPQ